MQILSQSHYLSMPWKNGLGATAQIAIEPKEAKFPADDFLWRLSSAQINAENKFSYFSGYDRLLTVLSGEGLRLNDHVLKKYEIFRFSGEENIDCKLISDQVVDLGLIFKRDQILADMNFIRNEKDVIDLLKNDFSCAYLYLTSGSIKNEKNIIQQGDTLILSKNQECLNLLKNNSFSGVLISINLI